VIAGTVLAERYRLISLLGRGGMGEVWRAEHLGLRTHVAVKVMSPTVALGALTLQRFHREAHAAATLRGPHVVQILDHGVDPATNTPFIAMELLEGESLDQRIQRIGRLTPADTVRIVGQIAKALARAHEAGIVHRDLKPENVFLVKNDDEETAKVLDFGIAKNTGQALAKDESTRTGAVMGTPFYMSPEQIGGAKDLDHRTDLWALGVIACECLTGRRPFDADTIGALVLAICTHPIPRPSSLGPVTSRFDAWFERAMAREPERRFQSARELSDALRMALEGEGPVSFSSVDQGPRSSLGALSSASSRTPSGEIPGLPRPYPAAARFVGLALLAVVGGSGALWALRPAPALTPEAAPSATEQVREQGAVPPPPEVIVAPVPRASSAPLSSAAPSAVPARRPPSSAGARSLAPAATAPSAAPPAAPAVTPQPVKSSGTIFDRRKG